MNSSLVRARHWLVAILSTSLGLALAGCGGSDGGDGGNGGGGSGGGGSGSSSAGKASTSGGSAGASSAGASATGGSSSNTGGKPGGSAGSAGSSPTWDGDFDACDPPEEGVENCSSDDLDNPGTSICTEFYTAGQAALICGEMAATGPCARGETLYGICVSPYSVYQYAESDGSTFYSQSAYACEAGGSKWCGPR